MLTQPSYIYFWLNDKQLSNKLVTQISAEFPLWQKIVGIKNTPTERPAGFHIILTDYENLKNGENKFSEWLAFSHLILLMEPLEAEEILTANTYEVKNYILKDTKHIFLHILSRVIKKAYDAYELRNRLQLYESIVVNTSEGVLVTEASNEKHERPRILYMNDAFTEITGYT